MIQPLSKDVIDGSIERQCARLGGFQRVDDALLFGIVAHNSRMVITFYVAYSTWDGRFLYVDQVSGDPTQDLAAGFKLLAGIAVEIGCKRLTWQYFEDKPMVEFAPPPPEVLTGWLTLHWSANDIATFLGLAEVGNAAKVTKDDRHIRGAFETTLNEAGNSMFRLRLAGEDDLDDISRLVQGLADYEKEPDSVHITKDHYRCDGFSSEQPLFYCVLMDRLGAESDNPSCSTCGMAFCYVATKQSDGMFLYLEDLFIEKGHRGSGAGMLTMEALARVSLSLNCSRMVWQALDWNTPALNFYSKLGAKVVDGLTTARYALDELEKFAREEGSLAEF